MDQADAEEAAGLFYAETLGEVEGVVVAVPGEDAAVAEKFGDGGGVVVGDTDGDGGAALVKAAGVTDAEEPEIGGGAEAREETRE